MDPLTLTSIVPIALSMIGAYGATRFAQGQQSTKIKTLEDQVKLCVTREELKMYIDLTRDDLKDIKENMRALRSDLGRTR
jgi:hypothetical protein